MNQNFDFIFFAVVAAAATTLAICLFGLLFIFLWRKAKHTQEQEKERLAKALAQENLEGAQSRFATVDGINLHYLMQGAGPDVLLLHGIAANVYTWRKLIPLLAPDRRVWALDIKGFGRSDKPTQSNYDFSAQANLILRFLETMKIQTCTVVGNSMGACIAAEMAVLRPDVVNKLVLINSAHNRALFLVPSRPMGWTLKSLAALSWLVAPFVSKETVRIFIENWLYGSRRPVTDDVVEAYLVPYLESELSYGAFWEALRALSNGIPTDRLRSLKNLKSPPLIIAGQKDRLVPIKFAQNLHNEIQGSRLEIHPTAGHHLQEEDEAWLAQKILELE